RRLDLAVSLIAAPPVLFLDEPTTGLDPRSRTELWEVLRGLVRDGTTLVLTTQYLEEADLGRAEELLRGCSPEVHVETSARRLTAQADGLADMTRVAQLFAESGI